MLQEGWWLLLKHNSVCFVGSVAGGVCPPRPPPPSSVKQTQRPLIVQRRLFELNAFFFFKCDINETSFFFFSFCKLFSFLCIKSWLFLVWFFFFLHVHAV